MEIEKIEQMLAVYSQGLQDLKDEFEKIKMQEKRTIKVPDNIKFSGGGIISPNGRMMLGYMKYHAGIYFATYAGTSTDMVADINKKNSYLIPCERELLKPGDICYGTTLDGSFAGFGIYACYFIVLNSEELARWGDDMDIDVCNFDLYPIWYKVISQK
jgi:hypothetical protein